MSDEPLNELERSLARATEDPSWRPRFYRDFLAADVYFVREGEPPEGAEDTAEAAARRLTPIEYGGEPYLVVFASERRLEEQLEGGADYVGMNARAFLELTRGADVFLHAGPRYGKGFTAAEIAAMLDATPGEAAADPR